jgi:hypothetical protein
VVLMPEAAPAAAAATVMVAQRQPDTHESSQTRQQSESHHFPFPPETVLCVVGLGSNNAIRVLSPRTGFDEEV